MAQLELVARASLHDAVLLADSLPAFSGGEGEDLVCGGCGGVLGAGISARTLRRDHPEGRRLIVRCTCRAWNLLAARQKRRRVASARGRERVLGP